MKAKFVADLQSARDAINEGYDMASFNVFGALKLRMLLYSSSASAAIEQLIKDGKLAVPYMQERVQDMLGRYEAVRYLGEDATTLYNKLKAAGVEVEIDSTDRSLEE